MISEKKIDQLLEFDLWLQHLMLEATRKDLLLKGKTPEQCKYIANLIKALQTLEIAYYKELLKGVK